MSVPTCDSSHAALGRRASWESLLADPGEHAHVAQIYQDERFLDEAVSHFAAEGVVRGEGIILVATPPHWKNISARLVAKGLQPDGLVSRGQLTVLDADATLPVLMDGSMPNEKLFKSLAGETISKARADGKYPRVRWWGEIVNALYLAGNQRASMRMEELCTEVTCEQATPIFCSFLMDKFDARIYDGGFGAVCRRHTHVIPAEDYVRHRLVVDRAVSDVIGGIYGGLLRSVMSWKGVASEMPSSQALLLWVKDAIPHKFEQVLARAREHEERERPTPI